MKSLPSFTAVPQLHLWANLRGTILKMSCSRAKVLFIYLQDHLHLWKQRSSSPGGKGSSSFLSLSVQTSHGITATSTSACFNIDAFAHTYNLNLHLPVLFNKLQGKIVCCINYILLHSLTRGFHLKPHSPSIWDLTLFFTDLVVFMLLLYVSSLCPFLSLERGPMLFTFHLCSERVKSHPGLSAIM